GKFLPLSKDQQRVCVSRSVIGVVGHSYAGVKLLRGALARCRIVSGYFTAFLQERLDQQYGWRFANVIGAALESQPQHPQLFAAQGPQSAAHLANEAAALFFIDAHNFVKQMELIAALAGHRTKRHQIFGKAGTAIAHSGIQETRPDTAVRPYTTAYLLNICAYAFADRCNRVDERNFHR